MNIERNTDQNTAMLTRKSSLEQHLAPPRPSLWRRLIRFLFWSGTTAVVLLIGLLTLIGFAGRAHWAFDAFSNFRFYYFATLTAVALLALLHRKKWLFWPTTALALLNFLFIAPYVFPTSIVNTAEAAPPEHQLRLLMANVFYYNNEPETMVAYIQEMDPDIVVLVEMTSELKRASQPLYDEYPYVLDQIYQENVILSRIPLEEGWYDYRAGDRPDAVAHLRWQGQPFTVVGTHPSTPLSRSRMAQRTRHLTYLATLAQEEAATQPVIVTGDLNTTPFSVHFYSLLKDGNLQDARYGFGLENTWPSFNRFIRIPLDHFLHSDGIDVHNFETGPFAGSDHRPIVVDFSLPLGQE